MVVTSSGRCEKIDFKICSELGVLKIAPGSRISDRWDVGKHLGSKIKSRKLKEIDFFTSSCPFNVLQCRVFAEGHKSNETAMYGFSFP
jgi:hypothetical protein